MEKVDNLKENINLIITSLTLFVSFIALLFTIIPYIKKKIIKKTSIYIYSFMEEYKRMNPWIFKTINPNQLINLLLRSQGITQYMIPRYKTIIKSYSDVIDLFSFYNVSLVENITFYEIIHFKKIWKKIWKKIIYIKSIVNNYFYIVTNKDNEIGYRKMYSNNISKTSISICPTFDSMKLFNAIGWCSDAAEEKYDLFSKKEKEEVKKFINELDSNLFCINICFEEIIEAKLSYAYSLHFKDGKIFKIETFFEKQNFKISFYDENKIQNQLKWISETFNILLPLEYLKYPIKKIEYLEAENPDKENIQRTIKELKKQIKDHAKKQEYEKAAEVRDLIFDLQMKLEELDK